MKTILCYGDSNAWGFVPAKGTRYPKEVRWPAQMARILGEEYTVIEDSISGRTTSYEDPTTACRCGLTNIGYSLLAHAPLDLIVVCLGTNDLKFTDAQGSAEGAAKLIDAICQADVSYGSCSPIFVDVPRILLVSPPTLRWDIGERRPGHVLSHAAEESTRFAETYKEVAKEKEVFFLDAAEFVYPSVQDCIHLDAEEHTKLAHAVSKKILEVL